MMLILVGLGVWMACGPLWAILVVCGPTGLGLVIGAVYGLVRGHRAAPVAPPAHAAHVTRRVVLMDMAHLPRTADGQVPVLLEETRRYVENNA